MKGVLKQGFLGIFLTRSLAVRNFGNILAMKVIFFFSKYLKLNAKFRNAAKLEKKLFVFLDICIWIGCGKLSLSRRKYLLLAVNVLMNSPKLSHITKRDILQLKIPQSVEKIWLKFCHADFKCVWDPLTCWLLKGLQKGSF